MSDDHPSGLPLLLKVPRVSYHLDCSDRHTYGLVEEGLLHLVKVGGKASRITRNFAGAGSARAKPADHVPGLVQYRKTKARAKKQAVAGGGTEPGGRKTNGPSSSARNRAEGSIRDRARRSRHHAGAQRPRPDEAEVVFLIKDEVQRGDATGRVR